MTPEPETFEEWRERTAPPRPAPWTARQHLLPATGLVLGGVLSLLVGEKTLGGLLLVLAGMVLVHAGARQWAAAGRVDDRFSTSVSVMSVLAIAGYAATGRLDPGEWLFLGIVGAAAGAEQVWRRRVQIRARLSRESRRRAR